MILNVDKSQWTPVKFGDVAFEPKESVKDLQAEGIKHVVGLEHIDTENLHLTRSASPEESTTFTKKFTVGDILFGRRRAYLKKAAQANFEGICSGDITVMRAKENLLPELLPFIVQNEKFFDYAIKHSAGGLSPRVKFKDLANYEFLLPPKDQLAQLAELLWAMDNVVEKENECLTNLKSTYRTTLNQFMIHGGYPSSDDVKITKCGLLGSKYDAMRLSDCLLVKPAYGANASSCDYLESTPRYIRITDIDDEGNLIDEDVVGIDSLDFEKYRLIQDDFLFARTGNTVGKTLLYQEDMGDAVYAGYLIRFRVNSEVLRSKFLFYFTKSLKYDSFKRKMIKVGAQPNINAEEYQSMYLPNFSVRQQDQIVKGLDTLNDRIEIFHKKISNSKSLQKSLINQVF